MGWTRCLGAVTDLSRAEAIALDLRQKWRQVKRATRTALNIPGDDTATRAWQSNDESVEQEEVEARADESEGDTEDEREETDSVGMRAHLRL